MDCDDCSVSRASLSARNGESSSVSRILIGLLSQIVRSDWLKMTLRLLLLIMHKCSLGSHLSSLVIKLLYFHFLIPAGAKVKWDPLPKNGNPGVIKTFLNCHIILDLVQ